MEVTDWVARRHLASQIDYSKVERVLTAPLAETRYAGCTWHSTAVQLISRDGTRQSGFGTDRSPARARLKAVAEAFERDTIMRSGLESRSGIALGFGGKAARQRAYLELVERDAYIRWSLGSSQALRIELSKHSIAIQFKATDPAVIVAGVADLTKDCLPFGLGAESDWESVRTKATGELVASLVRHQNSARPCSGR